MQHYVLILYIFARDYPGSIDGFCMMITVLTAGGETLLVKKHH
jgi:hypothetical protein